MASKVETDINKQHIYIDTVYLIHYLTGNGEVVSRARKQVKKAIKMTERNRDIHVKFPFIVAGEFINSICYDTSSSSEKTKILEKFFRIFNSSNIDFIPAQVESFKLASEIKSIDERLDDTDLLIAAQALCDIHSTRLLTNDPKLIESSVIKSMAITMDKRIRKLEISESV